MEEIRLGKVLRSEMEVVIECVVSINVRLVLRFFNFYRRYRVQQGLHGSFLNRVHFVIYTYY
jgi:hypothetical protein